MWSIKKITALILSAALVMSLTPVIPDMGIKAYAAEDTAEPSVQVYADVDTLTSDIFTPKYKADGSLDSDNTKVAKLKFGKNDKSAVQEWYILGPDENIAGAKSNIAIFAANDIINYQKFHSDSSYHDYSISEANDISYVKGDAPTQVAPSHYGGSDIRAMLRDMSDVNNDTYNYFSKAEKAMMQKTTVLTHDYDKDTDSSDNKLYTTSDKLYLASGKDNTDNYDFNIYVGSVSKSGDDYAAADEYTSKKLWVDNYWDWVIGNWFWLRSSYPRNSSDVLGASPHSGDIGYGDGTNHMLNVRPASNLNLSSVIFASAADAASASDSGVVNTIDRGTDTAPNATMTLRLNGDSKSAETELGGTIGSVKLVNNSKIVITRGTATAAVTLIIQGKDGDTDWYYAKNITAANASTPVTAADITGHTGADLSKCRIWLEAPMGDGSTLSYAVKATDHTHSYDTSKWISDTDNHWHECTDVDCLDPDKGKNDNSTAHDYGNDDTWYYDETNHYKKCIVCESDKSIKTDTKEAHTYGTDGKCTTCGYDISNVHTLELVDEVEPTCTSVGYKSYYKCKDEGCDVKYYSALGILIRIADMSEIELTKTEHVEGDSYSHNSSEHWLTCVRCGEPLKKVSHKLGSDYSSDDANHWKVCTICEAELEVTAHEPGADYSHDSDSHWQQCSICGEATAKESHNFDGDTCTTCGYQKPEAEKAERNTDTETKTETGTTTTTTRSSGGSHHDSAEVTDNSQKGRWVQDEKGWYFRRNDGSYPKSGWSKLKWLGKEYWYYFDENGYMKLGWLDVNGSRYYLNPIIGTNSGRMLTGWQLIDQKWYYFSTEQGAKEGSLLRNTVTPDNYRVDENGIWQQ